MAILKNSGNDKTLAGGAMEYDVQESTTSRAGAFMLSAAAFVIPAVIVLALTWPIDGVLPVVGAVVVGLVVMAAVHMAYEWERAVVVRLGRFSRVAGPGLYFTIPLIESVTARIDQRIRTTSFEAEETLSSDLVPVNVDAVLFWVIWDVERACKEVRNYEAAVAFAAQTAMRDVVGQISLSEIAMRRSFLDEELKRIISEKVDDWGITVIAVEIRDIVIPKELQASMARQAQAERERDARITLAEAERDISELYLETATNYGQPEKAMQLRTMNLVYDSVKDSGSMVVVPSAYSEGFHEAAEGAASEAARDIFGK